MNNTLVVEIWPQEQGNKLVRNIVLIAIGTLLLTISAKISIPFYPVPMTMQTFVVLVLGMAYGWRLGSMTVFFYLLEGAMGLPVFAGTPEKGIGLAYMMGPTGGYLIGFVLAAGVCGFLSERGWNRNIVSTTASMVLGNIIIYVLGLLWLGTLLGWDNPILEWGLTPFIFGDLAKIALAAAVLPLCWKAFGKK